MDGEKQIKFMTYNVWSRDDVVVYERMKVIGDLVRQHSPDVIFFQEITPYIHLIFESFPWWDDYHCSPVPPEKQTVNHHFCLMKFFLQLSKLPMESYARWKFGTSPTGKCYLEADITPGSMKPIRIATTQLECPMPPASMHLRDRYMQAKHAVSALSSGDNVVFGGDMSWDDKADMPFPLHAGWCDAWEKLKCGTGGDSWTYSSLWVEKPREFGGFEFPHLYKRSDRFLCKLQDYTLETIELIGVGHLEIYCYHKDRSNGHFKIMPSCHRGLVLTIVPK
ncbi:hypothetical protein CFC21_044146 [Triticum aestivum]|uniref:Endonuclease/exonuclease/phosphatase domain-containing protein n=2 Tax=Triticum aestivum TaxID=4565 RepID=A0A3B6G056_WHEAT|nr:hypothetical protein CFC21_044146 [Triticum aestivum]